MTYLSTEFPLCPGYGYRRVPRYRTTLVEAHSGRVEANRHWSGPLFDFFLPLENRTESELAELETLFHGAAGRYHTFPFQDKTNYKTLERTGTPTAIDQALGTAVAAQTDFPLYLNYTWGSATTQRLITRPVEADLLVALDGTPTTAFTWVAGVGIRLDSPAAGGEVVTWGGTYLVPVRFADDTAEQLIHDYSGGYIGNGSVQLMEDRE